MGTSSSFKGPKKNTPLLPSWADDNDSDSNDDNASQDDNQNSDADKNDQDKAEDTGDIPNLTGNWGSAKSSLSRLANNKGVSSAKGAARSYVRAMGGAKGASRSARQGKNAAAAFGGFISSVVRNGLGNTLEQLGLQSSVGQSAEYIFSRIADAIAPAGGTNEEIIARKAVLESLGNLYEKYVETDNLTRLESLSIEEVQDSLLHCIQSYIYQRWLHELGLTIEKKEISENEALSLEGEIKELITETVKYDFKDYDVLRLDFKSGEGKRMMDKIYDEAYSLLEL